MVSAVGADEDAAVELLYDEADGHPHCTKV